MPKAELLDPQGKAISGALARQGFDAFHDVRVGKRFELEVDGDVTDELLEKAREVAENFLANTVIEDIVSVRVAEGDK